MQIEEEDNYGRTVMIGNFKAICLIDVLLHRVFTLYAIHVSSDRLTENKDKEPNPNLKPIHLLLTEKGMVLHHFPVQLCKHRSKMNNDYINTNSRRTRPGSGLP